MSEELFERFKAVPRAKLLIEQFKNAPLDDESVNLSFLVSLACNVRMDIVAMHMIYDDLVEAAAPYMDEDDFDETVEAVTRQALDEICEVTEDHVIDRELDNLVNGLQAMLGGEQTDE